MERLPEGARIETGPAGLERLALSTGTADAHVYLHGAQVAHFQPVGERPALWMSGGSRFEGGKPIRGGVPICFPWFGPKAGAADAPMHGLVRTRPWALREVAPENGRLRATLELHSDESTRGFFPHDLRVSLDVSVGPSLSLALTVHNPGPLPFTFEEALHSYFAVSDVRRVLLHGLEGVGFVDKTAALARRPGEPGPIAIAAETDRVYLGAAATVTIEDPDWARRIVISKSGSRTTVVWNPWVAKAKAMPDFGDDEWTDMVCVETANALDDAVSLAPGESHTTTATIELRRAG
jgi:D-hexose-6-phosphate mutarotase